MAEEKITQKTALTTPAGEDLLYIVDDPSGTPIGKKITLTNLFTYAPGTIDLTGITDGNVPYMAAAGFADSPLSTDGTDVTISGASDNEVAAIIGSALASNTWTGIGIGRQVQHKGAIVFKNEATGSFRGSIHIINNNDGDSSTPDLTDIVATFSRWGNVYVPNGSIAAGHTDPDTILDIDGAFTFRELSSDPSAPDEGAAVLWMSNGNGTGDDGDVLLKITAGGVTKTKTLADFSAL